MKMHEHQWEKFGAKLHPSRTSFQSCMWIEALCPLFLTYCFLTLLSFCHDFLWCLMICRNLLKPQASDPEWRAGFPHFSSHVRDSRGHWVKIGLQWKQCIARCSQSKFATLYIIVLKLRFWSQIIHSIWSGPVIYLPDCAIMFLQH